MPCFRGVDVLVATQSSQRLPEFPPPVASLSPTPVRDGDKATWERPSLSTRQAACCTKQPSRMISVYIPSLPGEQFWIQYSIVKPPSPPCQLFFKMFLNGRLVTSWGINPRTRATGSVAKALYEPENRWDFVDADGAIYKTDGIETRYFHFLPGPERTSPAEDGGLMEIQVFRSTGKRRCAPRLYQYKNQEKYGISSPSGGLLETPDDAAYYEWLLIDPRDSPYATFRFHYRSWDNLRLLNLVSRADTSNGTSTPETQYSIEGISSIGYGANSSRSTSNITDISTTTSESDINEHRHDADSYRGSFHFLSTPPRESAVCIPNHNKQRQSYMLSDTHYTSQSRLSDQPPHHRSSSVESHTASITPSLLPDIDDDSFGTEDVEIGIATKISLPSEGSGIVSIASVSNLSETPETPDRVESRSTSIDESRPITKGLGTCRLIPQVDDAHSSRDHIHLQVTSTKCRPERWYRTQPHDPNAHKQKPIRKPSQDFRPDFSPNFNPYMVSESEWMRESFISPPVPSIPGEHVLPRSWTVPNVHSGG